MIEQFDVAIIGGGPAGYTAAIRSAQLGFNTICINKHPLLGGTCLHVGCIPSKTLLHATEQLYHLQNQGSEFGIHAIGLKIDFPKLMEKKKEVINGLANGIKALFSKGRITFAQGVAEFLDPHQLRVTSSAGVSKTIEASSILIATGSEPVPFQGIAFDERQILSSTGALNFSYIPKQLIVIGAGVIGVELASVYCRLGSQVSILEMLDHICPAMDGEVSNSLLKILQKQGLEFFLSSRVLSIEKEPDQVVLTVEIGGKPQKLNAEAVLIAVGRRPFTEGLHAERAGIEKDKKGFISVDHRFRTSQPHIFAVGDVIQGVMLAHRASMEGVAVIEALKGESPFVDYMAMPNVVYTYPEAASVGLTEEEAKRANINFMISKSYFKANSRARCNGEIDGFAKLIADKDSGRLVGLHILGPHASELIAEGMMAMQKKATIKDLADAPQAHPTFSEAIKEAALNALISSNNQINH